MILLLFALLLFSVFTAWFGKRAWSMRLFSLTLLLAIYTFLSHITDKVGISL